MRVMMKVHFAREKANQAARDGKLAQTIQTILDELKPEAVYFAADNGLRTALLFLNLHDSSEIPKVAEPWFLALDACIEMKPVMAPEDLAKASDAMEAATKKYG